MNSEVAAIVERAAAAPRPGPVTIVCADAAYGPMLENWLLHANAVGIENILVVALDEPTLEVARARSFASVLLTTGALTRHQLWTRRAELFAALAANGVDFIHSDADAVWLRSPIEEIFHAGVDLAFSQGTIWPADVVKHWGFVVCCGLFGVRAGPAASAFFASVVDRIKIDNDDQIAVNRVLLANGTVWRSDDPGEVRTWNGRPFRIFEKPIFGACGQLSLALLPHAQFSRLPEVSARTIVAHPLPPEPRRHTPQDTRRTQLHQLGLWRSPSELSGAASAVEPLLDQASAQASR